MAIVAYEPVSTFTPAPEGMHCACCCDVIDLGLADKGFGEKHYVELRWQLEADDDGKRAVVRRVYALSLNEKAALRKDLEIWRGKKFTSEELTAGFDVEQMIGRGCQVQITHRPSDNGKIFANVTAVIPLGKGQVNPSITDYVRK